MKIRENILRELVIIAFYAAVAAVMTWPVILNLGDRVAGSGGDPWQTLWRFSHKQSLWQFPISNFQFSNFIEDEFLGGGEPRLVNLSVWIWMPLHVLFGQPLAYNLVWLLSFILSGYFMHLLVRWLVRSLEIGNWKLEIGPFLAGLMYMLLPYHAAHSYGHFGAMQTQWLPLALLLLLMWLKRPAVWKAAAFAFVFVLQAWSEHHYGLWLAIAAMTIVLTRLPRRAASRSSRNDITKTGWSLAIAGVIIGIFVLLPYWPTVRLAFATDTHLALGVDQTVRFSADVMAYITPAGFHTLWWGVTASVADNFTGNLSESTLYLGLAPLLLILFFHQKIPVGQKRLWLVLAAVFFVISLGPRLHILGRVLPIPLPYALVDELPGLSSVRAVARAGVMVGLSMSVLFGLTVATQVRRRSMAVALGVLLLFEYMFWPVPMQATGLSPVYEMVSATEGRSVIEVPAATNYTASSKALYASLKHGKEIVGNIALERAEDGSGQTEARSLPGLRQVLFVRTDTLRQGRPEFFGQDLAETFLESAKWVGAGTVVIHTDSVTAIQLSAMRNFLEDKAGLRPQIYEDAVGYPISDNGSHDGVFAGRDGRWENVGYDEKRGNYYAEVPDEATLNIYNNNEGRRRVSLIFGMPPEGGGKLRLSAGDANIEVTGDEETGKVRAELVVPKGKTQVVFKNVGSGKVILENPEMEVR